MARQFALFGIGDRLKAIQEELQQLRGNGSIMHIVGYEGRSRAHALVRERRDLKEVLRKHHEETKHGQE